MRRQPADDLIVALGWYDGEEEGVARRHGRYSYFIRTHFDQEDHELHRYSAVPIDAELFDEIASMADASMCDTHWFMYDGSSDALNQLLGDIVPAYAKNLNEQVSVSLALGTSRRLNATRRIDRSDCVQLFGATGQCLAKHASSDSPSSA